MSTPAVRIREAAVTDSEAIGRVQLESWRSAYAALLPAAYLAQFSLDERAEDWHELLDSPGAQFIYVAETGADGIVGYALGIPEGYERYQCELSSLHILPSFRGYGAGRLLFGAIARHCRALGFESIMLWTLIGNAPARRFYEKLGGIPIGEKESEIGKNDVAVKVIDVGFGWANIDNLCRL